jgi:hypothetical protein
VALDADDASATQQLDGDPPGPLGLHAGRGVAGAAAYGREQWCGSRFRLEADAGASGDESVTPGLDDQREHGRRGSARPLSSALQ